MLVCGGGVHNSALMGSLQARLGSVPVVSTATRGVDPDWVEACALAWLAVQRVRGLPGNDMAVTGAHGPASLGAIYLPGA